MKVFELVNFNLEQMKKMEASGIRLSDAHYAGLFSEYQDMRNKGDKVSYIVAVLAEKYSVSERKVYALIKHFNSDCETEIFGGVKFRAELFHA